MGDEEGGRKGYGAMLSGYETGSIDTNEWISMAGLSYDIVIKVAGENVEIEVRWYGHVLWRADDD